MTAEDVVLITGVHGVSGRAAARHWASVPGVRVYGLSRRSAPLPQGVEEIIGDLLDRDDLQRKLGAISDITHIVFGAYVEKPTAAERSEINVAIIENLFDVVEKISPSLRHITFYQGGKAYGADLGPYKTPAREDDPRLMPPNFYYDQEDFLRRRQQGKSWFWTALRPEATLGFGIGNPMNLGMSIAVYASISKELGLPLRFPGTEKSYQVLYQLTSADILAKATIWAGSPKRRGTKSLISRMATISVGSISGRASLRCSICRRPTGSDASDRLHGRQNACLGENRRRHGLQPLPYEQISSWPFAHYVLRLMEFGYMTSTIKRVGRFP